MKRFWKTLLTSAVCLSLTACGQQRKTVTKQYDAEKEYGCDVLNVYNAGEYIGEDVVSNFETIYDARVNYDTFESNEMMYTKLLGGASYDVLVPSDYMIEQLMQEDMLQTLDMDAMTNYDNLNPDVIEMQKSFDPELQYSIPYFWGSVGIVYNKQAVSEEKIKEEGWNIFLDTDYKGRIYFYDSQRDGFMVAFKALGYSMNTDDEDEINDAYNWLKKMNDTMDPAYVTDEVIDGMVNNEMDIALMYSGDAAYVLSQNMDMGWIEPDQGTNIWIDAMVIPANSSCPGLANAFINYIISEDVQMENSSYVGYTSVDTDVQEYMSGVDGDYFENDAYTPRVGYAKDETFHYNETLKKKLNDLWNNVKVS
jgi:spermidine/putrescine transport system substrate-binding protein/spermidine/putrescine transport system permease protein